VSLQRQPTKQPMGRIDPPTCGFPLLGEFIGANTLLVSSTLSSQTRLLFMRSLISVKIPKKIRERFSEFPSCLLARFIEFSPFAELAQSDKRPRSGRFGTRVKTRRGSALPASLVNTPAAKGLSLAAKN
jgi:hypothetical protein